MACNPRSQARPIARIGLLVLALVTSSLLLIVGPAERALACSCAPTTEQELANRADVIFEGVAVARQDPSPPSSTVETGSRIVWTFDVARVLKGTASNPQRVSSVGAPSTCGVTFQLGPAIACTPVARPSRRSRPTFAPARGNSTTCSRPSHRRLLRLFATMSSSAGNGCGRSPGPS